MAVSLCLDVPALSKITCILFKFVTVPANRRGTVISINFCVRVRHPYLTRVTTPSSWFKFLLTIVVMSFNQHDGRILRSRPRYSNGCETVSVARSKEALFTFQPVAWMVLTRSRRFTVVASYSSSYLMECTPG